MISEIIIRDLVPEDIEEAALIVRQNWGEGLYYNSILEMREMFGAARWKPHYIVTTVGDKVVAYAGFKVSWLLWNIWELIWINVLPEYQGRGVGKLLTEKRLQILHDEEDAKLIMLMTQKSTFFTQFGFKTINIYDGWHFMTLQTGTVSIQPTNQEAVEARTIVEQSPCIVHDHVAE
jgi:ribosomal protein S18 acetylase RimI-like enzyme